MTTRVITLLYGNAWERYGKVFHDTFAAHWPKDVELVIFTDRNLKAPRATLKPLGPDVEAFRERWKDDRAANGYKGEGKIGADGKFWRWDAVKWAPQGIVPAMGLDGMEDGDVFCWLDGDVETTAKVNEGWLEGILKGHDLAALQRPPRHSEIGFWAIRVSPVTRAMVAKFADFYISDDVFGLTETHSAYVFDRAVECFPELTIRNLCPGKVGHVFPKSPLAECLIHKKGKRKDA